MSESFGKYAKYIIQDRALPDIRDGLKPVQRRILYAMHELRILHDKPYKKSARTVGEVIGKYHPHGDSSIYDAMIRMSQEWKNNLPLIDMQGNKGSLDGDNAAAMRYTECRLSKFGEYLLNDIYKDTVKFIPNFDDSEQEPTVLPTLLPNILINGATGIAAGYATNIPPFNLNEVIKGIIFRIKHPYCSIKQLADLIKGPDFPTGGIIQGEDGILEMYATGKGKFNILAKIETGEIDKKNLKKLIISEIPYETNKANIVKSIEELKLNNELPGLKEIRDDSDKDGISIVLEFDTKKDLEIIKNFLYKKTQLQISYTANIILIKDRKPILCNLIDIVDSFIEHANEIVIKSAIFDLKKSLNRKEILEGLIKAISDIDMLVSLIKTSNSKEMAKQKLIEHFLLNEKQAEAVVQLRLYVLTSYDTQKLIDEYKELVDFINKTKELILNKDYRNEYIVDTIKKISSDVNFDRRSLIQSQIQDLEIDKTDIIEAKTGICYVSNDCYIKFIMDNSIDNFDINRMKVKENDIPVDIFSMSTLDTLVILTNKGKCITIPAYKIKPTRPKENGIHINELVTIDSSEKVITAFRINNNSYLKTEIVVATKYSQIKRFYIEELAISKNAKSSIYIGLRNNDEVVSAFVVYDYHKEIFTFTSSGYAIRYPITDIPIVGRNASGVKNINLKNNDYVVASFANDINENFIFLVSNRGGKRIHYEDVILTNRATIGKRTLSQVDSNPYIINSAFMVGGRQLILLLTESGKIVEQKIADIPISDYHTRMNSFPNLSEKIITANWLKFNKNIVINHKELNFDSLNVLKNEEKKEENDCTVNEVIADLINKHIPQKIKEIPIDPIVFEENNNILELTEKTDHSNLSQITTENEMIIEKLELPDINHQLEMDDDKIDDSINEVVYDEIEDLQLDEKNESEEIVNNKTHTSLIAVLLENDLEKFKQLINDNSDVNEVDQDGQTPLMIVASSGLIDIALMLLKNNANPDICDYEYGYTALMYAVQNDDLEMVKLLVEHGANVNIQASDKITAIGIAVDVNKNFEIGKYLLEHNALASQSEIDKINQHFKNHDEEVEKYLLELTEFENSDDN